MMYPASMFGIFGLNFILFFKFGNTMYPNTYYGFQRDLDSLLTGMFEGSPNYDDYPNYFMPRSQYTPVAIMPDVMSKRSNYIDDPIAVPIDDVSYPNDYPWQFRPEYRTLSDPSADKPSIMKSDTLGPEYGDKNSISANPIDLTRPSYTTTKGSSYYEEEDVRNDKNIRTESPNESSTSFLAYDKQFNKKNVQDYRNPSNASSPLQPQHYMPLVILGDDHKNDTNYHVIPSMLSENQLINNKVLIPAYRINAPPINGSEQNKGRKKILIVINEDLLRNVNFASGNGPSYYNDDNNILHVSPSDRVVTQENSGKFSKNNAGGLELEYGNPSTTLVNHMTQYVNEPVTLSPPPVTNRQDTMKSTEKQSMNSLIQQMAFVRATNKANDNRPDVLNFKIPKDGTEGNRKLPKPGHPNMMAFFQSGGYKYPMLRNYKINDMDLDLSRPNFGNASPTSADSEVDSNIAPKNDQPPPIDDIGPVQGDRTNTYGSNYPSYYASGGLSRFSKPKYQYLIKLVHDNDTSTPMKPQPENVDVSNVFQNYKPNRGFSRNGQLNYPKFAGALKYDFIPTDTDKTKVIAPDQSNFGSAFVNEPHNAKSDVKFDSLKPQKSSYNPYRIEGTLNREQYPENFGENFLRFIQTNPFLVSSSEDGNVPNIYLRKPKSGYQNPKFDDTNNNDFVLSEQQPLDTSKPKRPNPETTNVGVYSQEPQDTILDLGGDNMKPQKPSFTNNDEPHRVDKNPIRQPQYTKNLGANYLGLVNANIPQMSSGDNIDNTIKGMYPNQASAKLSAGYPDLEIPKFDEPKNFNFIPNDQQIDKLLLDNLKQNIPYPEQSNYGDVMSKEPQETEYDQNIDNLRPQKSSPGAGNEPYNIDSKPHREPKYLDTLGTNYLNNPSMDAYLGTPKPVSANAADVEGEYKIDKPVPTKVKRPKYLQPGEVSNYENEFPNMPYDMVSEPGVPNTQPEDELLGPDAQNAITTTAPVNRIGIDGIVNLDQSQPQRGVGVDLTEKPTIQYSTNDSPNVSDQFKKFPEGSRSTYLTPTPEYYKKTGFIPQKPHIEENDFNAPNFYNVDYPNAGRFGDWPSEGFDPESGNVLLQNQFGMQPDFVGPQHKPEGSRSGDATFSFEPPDVDVEDTFQHPFTQDSRERYFPELKYNIFGIPQGAYPMNYEVGIDKPISDAYTNINNNINLNEGQPFINDGTPAKVTPQIFGQPIRDDRPRSKRPRINAYGGLESIASTDITRNRKNYPLHTLLSQLSKYPAATVDDGTLSGGKYKFNPNLGKRLPVIQGTNRKSFIKEMDENYFVQSKRPFKPIYPGDMQSLFFTKIQDKSPPQDYIYPAMDIPKPMTSVEYPKKVNATKVIVIMRKGSKSNRTNLGFGGIQENYIPYPMYKPTEDYPQQRPKFPYVPQISRLPGSYPPYQIQQPRGPGIPGGMSYLINEPSGFSKPRQNPKPFSRPYPTDQKSMYVAAQYQQPNVPLQFPITQQLSAMGSPQQDGSQYPVDNTRPFFRLIMKLCKNLKTIMKLPES